MATSTLTTAKLWVDDVAIHAIANTLGLSFSRAPQDATVFGNTARTSKLGLFVVEVSGSGFADFAGYDGDIWDIYDGGLAVPVSVSATGGDGDTAYAIQALQTMFQPLSGSVGEMTALSFAAVGAGKHPPIRGTILAPEEERTSTANGTPRQLGAVSATQTVYAALHVVGPPLSFGVSLDATVRSDSSSGMTSPTTRITFAQATGKTSEWKSTTGPITDNWWDIRWVLAGVVPVFTFAVIVGIA